jgi:hypothetical protein
MYEVGVVFTSVEESDVEVHSSGSGIDEGFRNVWSYIARVDYLL